MNDYRIESYLSSTKTEQISLIVGIKLSLVSELMLSFARFRVLINFRLIGSTFLFILSFPLLSCYSFSIAWSNALIPQLPSLPIQSSQLYIKCADIVYFIESLGQGMLRSFRSLSLQTNEMIYSYYSLSTSIIGSIFYLTTGLHGLHVLMGSFGFILISTRTFFIIYLINH